MSSKVGQKPTNTAQKTKTPPKTPPKTQAKAPTKPQGLDPNMLAQIASQKNQPTAAAPPQNSGGGNGDVTLTKQEFAQLVSAAKQNQPNPVPRLTGGGGVPGASMMSA